MSTPASPARHRSVNARKVPGCSPPVLRPGDIVIAAKMDRCFRSAFDALATIESFKRRKISLWLLDLGGDVSGNGISELIMTVLAAVGQFERTLISERIKDAKRNLRHGNRHQGGKRPFGWQYGEATCKGRARDLIPDEREQAALAEILALREAGRTLVDIRDILRDRGFALCKQTVLNILNRQVEGEVFKGLRRERPAPQALGCPRG
jgi:putative DNA-invertase from lambdoid prophage Rac